MDISRLVRLFLVSIFFSRISCKIDSISSAVDRLLSLLGRPADLSLIICKQPLESELFKNFTSSSSSLHFGSKFKPGQELGGQETAFIILDLECSAQKLQQALQSSQFNLVYSRWLIVNSSHSVGAVDEYLLQSVLLDTPIAQSTELFYFKETPGMLLIKQAFKRLKVDNSTVVLEEYGAFEEFETFRNLRTINTTTIRRKDLNGSAFELGIAIEDPDSLNHLDDFVAPEIDPVTKNGMKLARVMLEYIHAKPVFVVSDRWGSAYPPANNWTGMLGDLKAGKAEFAGTPTLAHGSRLEAVDYMSYSIKTWSKIVFRAPKLSYTTNVFLMPFDRLVWICAILLISLIICLLLIANWNEWNILVPANAVEGNSSMLLPGISDVLFLVLTNVFVQGSPISPRSTAGRIIIIFSLIFIVCLYVSYCAFIVALLQSPATNIKTVTDLMNSNIPVGNQDTVFFRFWLQVN